MIDPGDGMVNKRGLKGSPELAESDCPGLGGGAVAASPTGGECVLGLNCEPINSCGNPNS